MSQEVKVLLGIGLSTLLLLFGAIFFLSSNTSNSSNSSSPPPTADPKVLIRKDSNEMGNPSAKVIVVQFGDYQCPACGAAYPAVKTITDAYKGEILFVFRNFPLPMHQNAPMAAEAAEAAGEQGKYWQMHDMLYENQDKWGESNDPIDYFDSYAKSLGLDVNKFKQEVLANKFAGKIQEDLNDGNTLGVDATPTFFVNGQQVVVAQSYYDSLKSAIDNALK